MRDVRWSVIMPVKRREAAKTRLRGAAVGDVSHESLVEAITYDTVEVVLATRSVARVLVVTNDRVLGAGLESLGAHWMPDLPDAGLNPAVAYGASLAAELAALDGVAALGIDRPALRTEELAAALAAAATVPRSVVPDANGDGTAMLTALPGVDLAPAFGLDSAAAHTVSGAVALVGDWPTLRRDTDTPGDLEIARGLGLGPRTAALLTTARAS